MRLGKSEAGFQPPVYGKFKAHRGFSAYHTEGRYSVGGSLGDEPNQIAARLFCSIIYIHLIGWFFMLFGQFCGRNVVEN